MSKQRAIIGRASIFRGKEGGLRVQGILTRKGGAQFERHRKGLAKLHKQVTGREPAVVSDADVIEYLCFGDEVTAIVLERHA
jgi:hypothetical protein